MLSFELFVGNLNLIGKIQGRHNLEKKGQNVYRVWYGLLLLVVVSVGQVLNELYLLMAELMILVV